MYRPGLETLNYLKNKKDATAVGLGILIVDALCHNHLHVSASDDIGRRAVEAFPSVFMAPEVTDDIGLPSHGLDVAAAASAGVGATLLAKSSSGTKELIAIAAAAQTLSTAADGMIAHEGWLSSSEAHNPDVGGSAIESAFVMKFLLDKLARTESRRGKRILKAGAAAFAITAAFGTAYLDSKNFKTDFASHLSGLAAGGGASYLKNRSQKARYASAVRAGTY
jgi:hypothetical protein